VTTIPNKQRSPVVEAYIELYEVDYSALLLDPGNPQYILKFSPNLGHDGESVRFDGEVYTHIDIKRSGFEKRTEGTQPRPRIEVADVGGVVTGLIASVGDLSGAVLTRRIVFSRHIDSGEDPDSSQIWSDRETWVVSRKSKARPMHSIEFELAAPSDIQNHTIPFGRVERNLCRWRYLGTRCGWTREAGFMFKRDGTPTADAGEDVCGLRLSDCKLRHGAKGDPLRIGSFPGAGGLS
jgi:lambda family phage minor tail protein L